MVVYNGEKYISQAIQSILNQTYNNFEFIIINDASTDKTKKIIKSFTDKRIFYYKHKDNLGECISRNTALSKSNGEYIAVIDSDDISLPSRIEKQIDFLENNKDYGLIGSRAEIINKEGKTTGEVQSHAFSHDVTKVNLFFRNCFTHSAFMYRKKDLLKVGINKNQPIGVDYDTLVKISRISKVCNLDDILIQYRKHDDNMLVKANDKIEINVKKILKIQILELGIMPSDEELDIHYKMKKDVYHSINKVYFKKIDWLEKIYAANIDKHIFPHQEFYDKISGYWFNLINNPEYYSIKLINKYLKSSILKYSDRNILDHIVFIVKCLIVYKNRKN